MHYSKCWLTRGSRRSTFAKRFPDILASGDSIRQLASHPLQKKKRAGVGFQRRHVLLITNGLSYRTTGKTNPLSLFSF